MVNKKIFAIFCIFSFLAVSGFAQEISPDEIVDITEIRQPFEWDSAGDVLKYEIIIERLNEKTGAWEQCFTHETNEEETEACLVYIEPILPPGKYRSFIKIYNILGILEEDYTTQDTFTVYRAYKPDVKNAKSTVSLSSTIYLDDYDNDGVIEIEGKNLFMPDETRQSLSYTDYYLKNDKRIIKPDSIIFHDDEKNRKVRFQFDMKKLEVGKYHFYARDASGLHSDEDASSEFSIRYKKWMDFDVEAGYNFPIVLHDSVFPEYFNSSIYPMSMQARVSFMPFKFRSSYLGLGLKATYTRLFYDNSGYTLDGNLGTGHLLFVYQVPFFRRRLITELHAGAGVTYFNNIVYHFPHNIDSEALNSLSLSFDAGAAAQIFINKRLYTEIAADYVITLNKDMVLGEIMPSAGIGWQF